MNTLIFESAPRVLALRPVPAGGKLLAFADVELATALGPISFFDCALFESVDDRTGLKEFSVGPPSKPNPLPNSLKKFLPLVSWHPDVRRAVTDAIADAYRQSQASACAGNGGCDSGRSGGQL